MEFLIDGQRISLEEVGRMLLTYEGFNLQYQIRDGSDRRVKEDECLVPVSISEKTFIKEMEAAAYSYSSFDEKTGRYLLSAEERMHFSDAFEQIIWKLEQMKMLAPAENYVRIGKRMIEILRTVDAPDDHFPEYEIERIERIIYY